eukprot:CAMPEP_0184399606 /NCGR_PEP_ID=MMETSP0007-20130409/71169_1 /TAXON_ID=97485 /ORGANISM="Prymnesium parvum, Strain Texoma1" /LENGTH=99 /DNA_ID=CAMNT_0026754119 /DNA_START=1 /DNA_END=301 /DNA_ORIENTATION=-
MELLLAAPTDALDVEDAAAGQLTAALEAEGIFHLKPTEIRELLSRVMAGKTNVDGLLDLVAASAMLRHRDTSLALAGLCSVYLVGEALQPAIDVNDSGE